MMSEVNLQLFMNFEDVIIPNSVSLTVDYLYNLIRVRFDLKEEFTGIGSYLKDQCFCHTDSEPIIRFRYNDAYSGFANYNIPETDITFYENHVVLKLPYAKWLDVYTGEFGGMYG